MKFTRRHFEIVLLAVVIVCALSGSRAFAQSPVTVSLDTGHPGGEIPRDFCGLSYEIKVVLPDSATGRHYFNPGSTRLITAYQTLGIKHLRVGGNTAERATVSIPDRTDIDSLFAFAMAAGIKVIYTVRMEGNTPAAAADIARYVMDKYRPYVSCITVGNEPNKHYTYPLYLEEWKRFTAAITASVPEAVFCGPSTTPQAVEWSGRFANDMGRYEKLAFLSQHDYPGGDGDTVRDAAKDRVRLLSSDMYKIYEKFYTVFAPAVAASGIAYRLEEANSYGHGGAVGVSDTYAASLWILDYLYWWASHNALGINFHSGEKVMRGLPGPAKPNVYTPITSTPSGYAILPSGYGMKMFTAGSQGRLVPAHTTMNPDGINISSYSVIAADKCLYVTLINKEFGAGGRAAQVTIETGAVINKCETISMTAPGGDITSVSGVTIGGAGIREDGSWNGTWAALGAQPANGVVAITVPAATAMIVKVYAK